MDQGTNEGYRLVALSLHERDLLLAIARNHEETVELARELMRQTDNVALTRFSRDVIETHSDDLDLLCGCLELGMA